MDTFLSSDSHFTVYFVTAGEMHGFSHQNPLCELSGCFSTVLIFLLLPNLFWKEKTKNSDKVNSFFKKEKPIPGTLGSKQNISKEEEWMDVN